MSSLLDSFWAPTPTCTMNESPGSCPQNPIAFFIMYSVSYFLLHLTPQPIGVFRRCLHANVRCVFLGVCADQRKTPAIRPLVLFQWLHQGHKPCPNQKSVVELHCFCNSTIKWKIGKRCFADVLMPIISRSFLLCRFYHETLNCKTWERVRCLDCPRKLRVPCWMERSGIQ